MDDERVMRLLNDRADRLREVTIEEEPGENELYVSFRIGAERYSVDASLTIRVGRIQTVTQFPSVPSYFVGATYLNGKIVPLLDLRAWLGLPPRGPSEIDVMVEVRHGTTEVGFVADEIIGYGPIGKISTRPDESRETAMYDYVVGFTDSGVAVINVPEIIQSITQSVIASSGGIV